MYPQWLGHRFRVNLPCKWAETKPAEVLLRALKCLHWPVCLFNSRKSGCTCELRTDHFTFSGQKLRSNQTVSSPMTVQTHQRAVCTVIDFMHGALKKRACLLVDFWNYLTRPSGQQTSLVFVKGEAKLGRCIFVSRALQLEASIYYTRVTASVFK